MATHDTRRQSTESEVASSPATSTTCYQSASSSPDRARHQTPSEFERQAWGKGADGWHHPMTNGPRFVPGPGPMSRLTEPDIVRNGFPIDLLRLHAKKGPESAGTNHTDTIGMHPPACFRGDLKSSSQGDAALPPVGTPFGPTAQDTTSNGPGLDPHSASTRRTTDPRPSPYGEAGPNDKRKRNEFVQNVRKAAESNPSPSGQTGTMQMLPHQRSNSQSSFNLNAGLHESVHAHSREGGPRAYNTNLTSSTPLPTPPRSPPNYEYKATSKTNGPTQLPDVVFLDEESLPSACPSGRDPNPVAKIYCTYYLRNGMCDYQQRNCQYRHFFPPTWEGMLKIGFLSIPEWLAHVYPAAYKQLKHQLGNCPWGVMGAGSAKGRAEVSREHHATYHRDHGYSSGDQGYGNQGHHHQAYGNQGYARYGGQRGSFKYNNVRGGPQTNRKGNTYAPDRGVPQPQQRQQYPMMNQWVENATSGPAAPAPSHVEDDAQSIAASTDLMKFSSTTPSVAGSTTSKRGRRNKRRSSSASTSGAPAGLFAAGALDKHALDLAAIELRNAEMAKQVNGLHPADPAPSITEGDGSGPSSPAPSTSSGLQTPLVAGKLKPMDGSQRLRREVTANAMANDKTHATGEKAQAAAIKAAADKAGFASSANANQAQQPYAKNKKNKNSNTKASKRGADKETKETKVTIAEATQAMLALREKELELMQKELNIAKREAALAESRASSSSSGQTKRKGRGRSANKKASKPNGHTNGNKNKAATACNKPANVAKEVDTAASVDPGRQSPCRAASAEKKEDATPSKSGSHPSTRPPTPPVLVGASIAPPSPPAVSSPAAEGSSA